MLKQRVITAFFLLAILLPALFYRTPVPFCAVALLLIAAGAWEWGRLNSCTQAGSLFLAVICLLMCGLSWHFGLLTQSLPWLWRIAGVSWVLVAIWLLRKGVSGWLNIPRGLRLLGGLVALWLSWLAVSQARVIGINFLMSVLVLVWGADIFAYIAGRLFGGRFTKRKLAPSISPGKSWEGVWGAITGVVVLSILWGVFERFNVASISLANISSSSLYSRLWAQHGPVMMMIAVVFLVTMSAAGDLVESLVKRSAGVKDSSGLLPGHGGVLDRVDALLPTLPLALMFVSL